MLLSLVLQLDIRTYSLDIGNDRACVLELSNEKFEKTVIITVYLPEQRCQIDDLAAHLDVLDEFIRKCLFGGEAIVIGDTSHGRHKLPVRA